MLHVLPFDTLHVIAGGETTRLQEARGLRTPVRETCAATGMEAPATSAEYRGIACSPAIFVPTTPRLLIAFPASRIRRDCRHWSSAGLNAELWRKPISESALSPDLGARFSDLCNPGNGIRTADDQIEVRKNPQNYALPKCFIENDGPDTPVSDTGGLLYR
jgi:hypothetical protein